MTLSSLIIVLFIFLLAGLLVMRPFLDQAYGWEGGRSSAFDSLLAERERLFAAIEELDLDLELNKISAEEHASRRKTLLRDAAGVLKKIEEIPESAGRDPGPGLPLEEEDRLERMIEERRQALQSSREGLCPACGSSVSRADQFCSHCGEKL